VIRRFFQIDEHGTTLRREALAGVTTFLTMAYVLLVHPGILEHAGMDRQASVAVTAVVACAGSLAMGLYARRPFAVAPYMGENAFITYTVVLALGHSWQVALGAVFLGGLLFVITTLLGLRSWLSQAIPASLKHAFVAGIGFFLAFVGLLVSGIVVKPTGPAPLALGDFSDPRVGLALASFILIIALRLYRVRAAILLGAGAVAAAGALLGQAPLPAALVTAPVFEPLFLELDIAGALRWELFPVVLAVFVLAFVDTLATLLGVSARAGLLDARGNLPEIQKPMLVDSLATAGGALLGATPSGAYVESAAGVEAGGRTGLTAVVTGLCFLPALFLGDLLGSVPPYAYGPALIAVGLLMLEPVRRINFADETEVIPAFATVVLMSFTFNIGQGITFGLILYPLLKLICGRAGEVHPGLWVLAGMSLSYYVFLEVLG
jgi:AGZA family xanthine/uracil permease-like MFS transporter